LAAVIERQSSTNSSARLYCPPSATGRPFPLLKRDRDRIFGVDFVEQVKAMGIKQVLAAPRSPWQRAYLERVIGTISARVPGSRDRIQ
jgi:hypothetical protein